MILKNAKIFSDRLIREGGMLVGEGTIKKLATGGSGKPNIEKKKDKHVECKIEEDNREDDAWKEAQEKEPEPDSDVLSEVQAPRKQGWCYIGTDRGYRSCVKIGAHDECMSGKVYHTQDISQDPNLRE